MGLGRFMEAPASRSWAILKCRREEYSHEKTQNNVCNNNTQEMKNSSSIFVRNRSYTPLFKQEERKKGSQQEGGRRIKTEGRKVTRENQKKKNPF